MDFLALASHYLSTYDTLAQVLATLYIAIAIFSGEQVSTAFKSQQPQIRVNPRRYLSYLNLWQASSLLITLAFIGELYDANLFANFEAPVAKAVIACAALTVTMLLLLWTMYDALVHRRIENKYKTITGSVSRLIAWALEAEKDKAEHLKLTAVLLERTNDVDLEHLMLRGIIENLNDLLKYPAKHRAWHAEMLAALRALQNNMEKRPLEDPEYYERFFSLAYEQWFKTAGHRAELHDHGIFQLTITMAGIAKELQAYSLHTAVLGYDYFSHLKQFMHDDIKRENQYFMYIGNDLLKHIVDSPQEQLIWDGYIADWRVKYGLPLAKQPVATQKLYDQYIGMASKTWLRDSPEASRLTDTATSNLFPDIDVVVWAKMVTLKAATRQYGTTRRALHMWLEKPRHFGTVRYVSSSKHAGDNKARNAALVASFNEIYGHSIELTAHTTLFTAEEVAALLTLTKQLVKTTAASGQDSAVEELQKALQDLQKHIVS